MKQVSIYNFTFTKVAFFYFWVLATNVALSFSF